MQTYVRKSEIDAYPEKDKYIPEAMIEASKTADHGTGEWSLAFIEAMNTILSEKGLRVL